MAVPKRYTSKARKHTRRSAVWKLQPPTLVRCKECKELFRTEYAPTAAFTAARLLW